MSRVAARWPLREQLRDPVDDASIERMWRTIETQQQVSPRRAKVATWCLAAVAAVVLFVIGGAQLRQTLRSQVLLTDSDTAFVRLVAPASATIRQRFADGSTIEAAPNTTVQGLASTPQEFSTLLERGSINVSVTPGGPRRWIIETKLARVEVVGTKFSVERLANDEVSVAVKEGVVLVRSALLAQGVERLSAGHSLHIVPPAPRLQPPEPLPSLSSSTSTVSEPTSPLPNVAAARTTATISSASPHQTAATLMQQADAARVSGEVATAERLLEQLVREEPDDPQATLAAYTLGVVRLQLGEKVQAIDALRLALALGPSSSLQQDCYLRLVEAELAVGHRDVALQANREYQRRFPAGRHRRALATMLGDSGDATAP
jgi:transmembrane sensor